ncbi:MAG: hypothetical protein ACJ790_06870, partial [Myxococcaceae bacterium]
LEQVASLKGPQNAATASAAKAVAVRAARELKADLDFAYPATGRLAYSLTMRGTKPITVQLEDGNHLKTTLNALKALTMFKEEFAPVVARMEKRLPEIHSASPEDLNGRSGHIYSDEFNAFRAEFAAETKDGKVTATELSKLDAFSKRDGLVTSGERSLMTRAKALTKK